mmetsp:Transcript_4342/g.13735  ORF Transcript_4342/g.13735 Transcript_4342/m.13735 type:complete len:146 (-) Transcript_4342:24-461(-)
MIRAKDLHALLKKQVDEQGGGGALLTNGKGAILAAAGFCSKEPKAVGAIAAHAWAHLKLVPEKNDGVGELRSLVFEVAGGALALGELLDASYFVMLYSERDDAADLPARLEALQAKVVGSFGEALSGEAPPPEPSGGEDADAAEG